MGVHQREKSGFREETIPPTVELKLHIPLIAEKVTQGKKKIKTQQLIDIFSDNAADMPDKNHLDLEWFECVFFSSLQRGHQK